MYESGIFTVVAAGNEGGNGPDCKVSLPGSALASFTVGGQGTRNSDSGTNNKERVYYDLSNTGHASAKITLSSYRVTSDNAGCGQNSNMVYLSWYYEDHARNDSNGPGPEILTD